MIARQPVRIETAAAAVLIVDLQEEQRTSVDYPVADIDRILRNTARVIASARSAGVPVIHGRYRRDFSTLPPRPFEPLTAEGRPAFSEVSSPGTEICQEVAPLPDEPVFDKQAASCFSNPRLAEDLAGRGVRHLFVCGVWTEACIASTITHAVECGFQTCLVKDACGSGTDFMHRVAVINIANRFYGGRVVSAEQAEVLLAGGLADTWVCTRPVEFRFEAADVDRIYQDL